MGPARAHTLSSRHVARMLRELSRRFLEVHSVRHASGPRAARGMAAAAGGAARTGGAAERSVFDEPVDVVLRAVLTVGHLEHKRRAQ